MGRPGRYKERNYTVGQSLLTLRTRARLTQGELAVLVGVNRRSIQHWETAEAYPREEGLQRLIAVLLAQHIFSPGHEQEEVRAVWDQVSHDAPRRLATFDEAWFSHLLRLHQTHPATSHEQAVLGHQPSARAGEGVHPSMIEVAEPALASVDGQAVGDVGPAWHPVTPPVLDWGDALEVPALYGRAAEVETLGQWVVADRCRVVALLGLGGIGKSSLAIRFAQQVAARFEVVIFRSLRDAPPVGSVLDSLIRAIAGPEAIVSDQIPERLAQLIRLYRARRCLCVLDNVEAILQEGDEAGAYRAGYENYGTLIQRLAETAHQSCLLLTSREKPVELAPLEEKHGPVRSLTLAGLSPAACEAILEAKDIACGPHEIAALVQAYGGNPLALKLVSTPIRDLFAGDIGAFLAQGESFFNGVGKLLGQQIDRASALERSVLEWLATLRTPTSLDQLLNMVIEPVPRSALLLTLEALLRRGLIERVGPGARFTLQPVIMEYLTVRLIAGISHALLDDDVLPLTRHAFVQATARDYVRRAQERVLARPILEQLVAECQSQETAEQRLLDLLERWRGQPQPTHGYGPGNVLNLLSVLRGHLRGVDCSNLSIRQAYLQDVEMQDTSLAHAHLSESMLSQGFAYGVCVALSADGTYLAAGTNSGEVRLWRVADRALLLALRVTASGIYSVALSADGQLLVAGDVDGMLHVWEASSGERREVLHGHQGLIHSVALSADGRVIASGSFDETVRLWSVERGTCLTVLQGHAAMVWGVALSADGSLVASGGVDGMVRLWSVERGTCLTVLQGHTGGVWDIALSADGQLLASGGVDGTVRLWNTNERTCRAIIPAHQGLILGVALSGDGRVLASGGMDGTIRVWNTTTGQAVASLQGHTGLVRGVALTADGQLAASASFDGTIKLWEAPSSHLLASLQGRTSMVWTLAFDHTSQVLAAGGQDGTIRLWEVEEGRLRTTLHAHAGMLLGLALNADGSLLASSGFDGAVKLWQIGPPSTLLMTFREQGGPVWAVALSADGRFLASGDFAGTVRVWESTSGRLVTATPAHSGPAWGVALSADGQFLASSGFDGTILVWETRTNAMVATLRDHHGPVWGVALSADGRLLVSGGEDGTIRLWEVQGAHLLATIPGHQGAVFRVAVSANGQVAASGGMDGVLGLWRVRDQRRLMALPAHSGAIWDMALGADGRLVAHGTGDGAIALKRVPDDVLVRVLRTDRPYERMDITDLTGISGSQHASLRELGAVEVAAQPSGVL